MNELIEFRINALEEDVKSLWAKWDNVQKLLVGTLVTLVFNLIGVIALLTKTFVK